MQLIFTLPRAEYILLKRLFIAIRQSKERADQGYRGTFKNTFEVFHNLPVDISPRIKNEFEIQPLRWIVERTFSWFNGSRRLSKDYEIKSFYQENICIISNFATLLRRF